MLEFIQYIDIQVFHILNTGIANSVFDSIMPFITNQKNWTLVYLFLLGWLFWKGGKHGRICAIALIVTIAITDQINSTLLKDLFDRIRPCHCLDNVRLLVNCGSGKSFPSSHAANNFAAAFVLAYFYRQYFAVYIVIAVLVAFSRIYVGVHYPLDILGGAIVGITIGYFVVCILKKFYKKGNQALQKTEN